jgi:hypothetical protein
MAIPRKDLSLDPTMRITMYLEKLRGRSEKRSKKYHDVGCRSLAVLTHANSSVIVPTGRSQTNLLLLAHQHILRTQVWWFMKEKKLPPEFEVSSTGGSANFNVHLQF